MALSIPTTRPPIYFCWLSELHNTPDTVELLLSIIPVLQNPQFLFSVVSVSSVFFIHFSLTLSHFLLYLQADQTLASAAFSVLPEARELHNPLISPKDNIWQQDRPPAAPVAVQADQYLAGAACCPGDNEQGWTDGQRIWEEDLDTATHPVCQHCGSSGPNVYSLAITHSCLVICLWASPTQTHTHVKGNVFNILSNTSFMRL